MNPRVAHLLMRLYPRAWRERYGAEFEALLEAGRSDLRVLADVVWSALLERLEVRERIEPIGGGKMDEDVRSFSLRSWCLRAPWAMFGVAPVVLLAAAYFAACLYLWFGWKIFLPGAETPFGGRQTLLSVSNLYFQAGKAFYFGAPVLVGWGACLIAARQRAKAVWLSSGLCLIALLGGTAQIHAGRTEVPGLGHISMGLALGQLLEGFSEGLVHASILLAIMALPYLLWRFRRDQLLSV